MTSRPGLRNTATTATKPTTGEALFLKLRRKHEDLSYPIRRAREYSVLTTACPAPTGKVVVIPASTSGRIVA